MPRPHHASPTTRCCFLHFALIVPPQDRTDEARHMLMRRRTDFPKTRGNRVERTPRRPEERWNSVIKKTRDRTERLQRKYSSGFCDEVPRSLKASHSFSLIFKTVDNF